MYIGKCLIIKTLFIMKKIYLSIIALMFVLIAYAQTVENVEGYYYLVSPNAQYYAGAQEGSTAFRYSLAIKGENRIDPEGDFGFKPNGHPLYGCPCQSL